MTVATVKATVDKARKVPPPGAADAGSSDERPCRSFDAADLVTMEMADPTYIVRPYVAEGVTLVVGRPKMGKTTLLRQLAVAVNTSAEFFSETCTRVPILFLSLEEGERIMRKKFKTMSAKPADLRGIRLEFEWPQGATGVQQLRDWMGTIPKGTPALIVIDSLTRFRIPPSDRGNAFTEDYNTVKLLADLCKEFPGLCVLVLHHTTKAMPDDPVSAISGTYGLTAAADNYLIVLRQGQQFRLHAGGRLWEGDTSDFELRREAGGWTLAGEWEGTAAQGLTPLQADVIAMLKSGAKSSKVIAEKTGQSQSALSHLMRSMQSRGLVVKIANGWGLTS